MTEKQIKIPVNDLKDKVVIIKQGRPIVLDKPASGYGEHTITWVDGKITADRVSYTNKHYEK